MITKPTWRSVEEGRTYSVRIDFSNDRYYDNPPAEGVVSMSGERSAGLIINLRGNEFITDFAGASWMEVRLSGTLIASLNLRGTREVMRRVYQCSSQAFRQDTRDPFASLPSTSTVNRNSTTRPDAAARQTGGSISDADYPSSSIRAGAEGTTRVSISIGSNGFVTGCSVVSSSGFQELDTTTCSLVQRRFRYSPAIRGGQPVESTVFRSVTWRLPPAEIPVLPPKPIPST